MVSVVSECRAARAMGEAHKRSRCKPTSMLARIAQSGNPGDVPGAGEHLRRSKVKCEEGEEQDGTKR